MNTELIKKVWQDLRCLKLFPKSRRIPQGKAKRGRRRSYYWNEVARKYECWCKRLMRTDYHWYVITYKDGTKELSYIRLRQGGLFSGMLPDAYRGILIPRRLGVVWYSQVKETRIAF